MAELHGEVRCVRSDMLVVIVDQSLLIRFSRTINDGCDPADTKESETFDLQKKQGDLQGLTPH